MRLRITEERSTFVYATSPISFGGVSKEDMFIWMVSMALTSNITGDSLVAFFTGCAALYVYKKATTGQPPGFLVHWASVSLGAWENAEWLQNVPPLLGFVRSMNKIAAKVWIENGLLPAHTHCNVYEP